MVLKTCLHQLGQQHVSTIVKKGSNVSVSESILVAITAWKSEVSQEVWTQIVTAPAKTCASTLALTPSEHYSVAPWGRAFRGPHGVSEPGEAISFQFHVRVTAAGVEPILRRSGFEGIYIVPKSETLNRADERFAIVWMPESTFDQVVAFTKEASWHLGIARAGQENTHWGVRVNSDDFAKTYAKVHPTKTIPVHLVTNFLAKISPVPVGANHDNIRTWLHAQSIGCPNLANLHGRSRDQTVPHMGTRCYFVKPSAELA